MKTKNIKPQTNTRSCCTNILKTENPDYGFMGFTHALSSIFTLIWILVLSYNKASNIMGISDLFLWASVFIVVAGASVMPDLDNTNSTAESSLWFFGEAFSILFRWTSTLIQSIIRMPREVDLNPHRGFWHTLTAAALSGAGIWLLANNHNPMPFFGAIPISRATEFFVIAFCGHLGIAAIFNREMKKYRARQHTKIMPFLISILLAFTLTSINSVAQTHVSTITYFGETSVWLGMSVALGMAIHTIGDTFTTAGTPIFFPFSVIWSGKFWHKTRFSAIETNGDTELVIMRALFLFGSIFGAIILVLSQIPIS